MTELTIHSLEDYRKWEWLFLTNMKFRIKGNSSRFLILEAEWHNFNGKVVLVEVD